MSWSRIAERLSEVGYVGVEKILEEHPYLREAAERLREQKLKVIDNLEGYVQQTIKSVERIGGHAHLARNAEEARRIVGEIVDEDKLIVFSKTNAAYEVGLREHLQALGKEVWETDLGEFLVQVSGGWPAHIVAPAIDMTRADAAQTLTKVVAGVDENSSVEQLVAAVRSFLMDKYLRAQVGITGANAVAADTGSVVLVENEGNIRVDTVLPPKHVVVVGVDKIVPTLRDALDEAMIQAAYAGLYPPTYVNVTSGPSSTADIEQTRITPATGPREFHMVLLDNGRLDASRRKDIREALLCIRCGRCYFTCPVYRVLGKKWVSRRSPYNGPMGVMWCYITTGDPTPAAYCTHSGNCREVCPMKINIPEIIRQIKHEATKQLNHNKPNKT
jgi:L-lactate dehydrogenase complex protein LldG